MLAFSVTLMFAVMLLMFLLLFVNGMGNEYFTLPALMKFGFCLSLKLLIRELSCASKFAVF